MPRRFQSGDSWEAEQVDPAANAFTFTKAAKVGSFTTIKRILVPEVAGTGTATLSITSGGVVIFEDADPLAAALGAATTTTDVIDGPFTGLIGEAVVVTIASTTITGGRMHVMLAPVP